MSQEFVVDLAPLFTCSILILVMLDVVNVATDPLWFVLGWSFILSLLMGAPPSVPDLAGIYRAFYKFPGNSLFQLANIIGAFLMGWLVGSLVPITFPFRCMQYVYYTILTIAFYFVFKGIGLLGLRMFTRPQPSQKGAPVHKFRLKENRWTLTMKGFCYLALIIAFLAFYQSNPMIVLIILGILLGGYAYFKSKKTKKGGGSRLFGLLRNEPSDLTSELLMSYLLIQQSLANHPSGDVSASGMKSEEQEALEQYVEGVKKEVLGMLDD
jgi:hypothetical protein